MYIETIYVIDHCLYKKAAKNVQISFLGQDGLFGAIYWWGLTTNSMTIIK